MTNPPEAADLVTFTEEILNGKFNFLCTEKNCYELSLHTLIERR